MDGLALSALDWWEEAGVDTFVDELPRNWLAAVKPAEPAAEAAAPIVAPVIYPDTLAGFRAWLLTAPEVPGRAAARTDALGDAGSGSAILVDMPEAEDRAARTLLSGKPGALLDRMLGAIALTRETVYLLPFSPTRPASGTLDAAAIATLRPIAEHHLTLAAPRRLLIMGEAPTRALLGMGCNEARGRVHAIEIGGRTIQAVATFPPRFILQAANADDLKARRAKVWADLQSFMGL